MFYEYIQNRLVFWWDFLSINIIEQQFRFKNNLSLQLCGSLCLLQKMLGTMYPAEYGKANVSANTNFQKISARIRNENLGPENTKSNGSTNINRYDYIHTHFFLFHLQPRTKPTKQQFSLTF